MRGVSVYILCAVVVFGLAVSGCGAKKEESSKAAINQAKTMETVEQKVNYLISQAKAFYNSKDFQDAVDVAQYVLTYLDKESQQAKDLLAKAKEALSAEAKKMMDEAKKGLSGFGK